MRLLQGSIEASSIVRPQHSLIFGDNKGGSGRNPLWEKMLASSGASRKAHRKTRPMAYVSSNRTTTTLGLSSRLAEIAKDIADAWHAYSVYRQTLSELQGLSHRELNDIGINPSMLHSIALEAAYGKQG